MSNVVADERTASRKEDAAMVQAVLDGDATAYQGLVEKYQERVYSMIYGMIRHREDARDLTQEAFVKAFRNLKGFRLEAGFYTWLYRIAMNVTIDFTRSRKRRETAGFDEAVATRDETGNVAELHHGDSPSKRIERQQLFDQIMGAMEKLSDDQRQVVLLRELEGLSYREIAEIMEIPEGTVMSRLFYARKKLQKLLEAEGVTER